MGGRNYCERYYLQAVNLILLLSILISAFCHEGKADEALNMRKLMMEKGLKRDVFSYAHYSALYKKGELGLAIGVLELMVSNGCLPDIIIYNFLLGALYKNGKAEQAREIFHKVDDVVYPDVSSHNGLLSALWNVGDRSRAIKMVEKIISEATDPNEINCNAILSCLCREIMVDRQCSYLRTWRTIESNQP